MEDLTHLDAGSDCLLPVVLGNRPGVEATGNGSRGVEPAQRSGDARQDRRLAHLLERDWPAVDEAADEPSPLGLESRDLRPDADLERSAPCLALDRPVNTRAIALVAGSARQVCFDVIAPSGAPRGALYVNGTRVGGFATGASWTNRCVSVTPTEALPEIGWGFDTEPGAGAVYLVDNITVR